MILMDLDGSGGDWW